MPQNQSITKIQLVKDKRNEKRKTREKKNKQQQQLPGGREDVKCIKKTLEKVNQEATRIFGRKIKQKHTTATTEIISNFISLSLRKKKNQILKVKES